MAVYKRSYKRYAGPITGERWRFAILTRYSFRQAFESRAFLLFFALCFIPGLFGVAVIYLRNNLDAVGAFLGIQNRGPAAALQLLTINSVFFTAIYKPQMYLAFFVVTFLGPGLVSPDVVDNAMPLYLSRPFSRTEYVLGKLSVLLALTSLITWVPGVVLFATETDFAGLGWLRENARLAIGFVVGSLIWIVMISLVAMALSAWIKWKPVAAAALFGSFFVAGAFGHSANQILELTTPWGTLLDVTEVMKMLLAWLFDGITDYDNLPVWSGFLGIAFFCGISIFMLSRKIRPCEVVR